LWRVSQSLFEREPQSGKDAELKAFAERLLPKLRGHLEEAQQVLGAKWPARVRP
jgi:predicted outer membrane protein